MLICRSLFLVPMCWRVRRMFTFVTMCTRDPCRTQLRMVCDMDRKFQICSACHGGRSVDNPLNPRLSDSDAPPEDCPDSDAPPEDCPSPTRTIAYDGNGNTMCGGPLYDVPEEATWPSEAQYRDDQSFLASEALTEALAIDHYSQLARERNLTFLQVERLAAMRLKTIQYDRQQLCLAHQERCHRIVNNVMFRRKRRRDTERNKAKKKADRRAKKKAKKANKKEAKASLSMIMVDSQ
jgi:hypothetical protein